jgi:hypothetical protein
MLPGQLAGWLACRLVGWLVGWFVIVLPLLRSSGMASKPTCLALGLALPAYSRKDDEVSWSWVAST